MRLRTSLLIFFSVLLTLMDTAFVILAQRQIHATLLQDAKEQMNINYVDRYRADIFAQIVVFQHYIGLTPELAHNRNSFIDRNGPRAHLEAKIPYAELLLQIYAPSKKNPPRWLSPDFNLETASAEDRDYNKLYFSIQAIYGDTADGMIRFSNDNLDLIILADREGRPYACVTSDTQGKAVKGAPERLPVITPSFQKLITDCLQSDEGAAPERVLQHSDGHLYLLKAFQSERTNDVMVLGSRVDAEFVATLRDRSGGMQCAVVYEGSDGKLSHILCHTASGPEAAQVEKDLENNLSTWLKSNPSWGSGLDTIQQSRVGSQEYLYSRQTLAPKSGESDSLKSQVIFFKPLAPAEEHARRLTHSIVVIGLIGWVAGLAGTLWIAGRVASGIEHLSRSLSQVGQGDLGVTLEPIGGLEVRQASTAFNQMVQQLRQRSMLAKMVPKTALEAIEKETSVGSTRVHGRRIKSAVLFSDIRGFTTLSERLAPADVVSLLDLYMGRMSAVIEAAGGDVIDYIGDAILADFEDRDGKSGAVQAVIAGYRMCEALLELKRENAHPEIGALAQGVGLHYGELVKGEIGGQERSKYTIIGDTVNVAARIQDRSRDGRFSCVLVSQDCCDEFARKKSQDGLEATFEFVEFGEEKLKGKTQHIQIMELKNVPPRSA